MDHNLTITHTITIHAPAAIVWEALTNPEIIRLYLYGTQTITDWRVGSPVSFEGEYEGHGYTDKGIVKENIPLQRLSYSYWSSFSGTPDLPENYSLVTYSLKAKDKNTTDLTWDQRGFANEEGYEHAKNGMGSFMETVKKIVAEM